MYEFIMRRALNDVATLTPGQMGVVGWTEDEYASMNLGAVSRPLSTPGVIRVPH